MPEGTFGMVFGGAEAGQQLVTDPNICAVGFTGSLRAGRALFDLAAARPRPIPVFAEMGSVNPIFLLPGALSSRGESLAAGYANSLTVGIGQFCTNPGVVVALDSPDFDSFLKKVAAQISAIEPGKMLHEGIGKAYEAGVQARSGHPALDCQAMGAGSSPSLFTVSGQNFLDHPELREELFGPSAIAVRGFSWDEMLDVARALEGQLTASVHFDAEDMPKAKSILPLLVRIAGRIVANGYPTGVEVNSAMQHGGPYPATTDSRWTSVGTAAIQRFVRPVALQNFPKELLPFELQ
jgi:NADP-dependent aldehyde dehydrogenase